MASMLKLITILALCLASTFLLLNTTGWLTVEKITHYLELVQQSSPVTMGGIVALLLFADLFIAMPTLTIMILSGFFLGPVMGAIFSIIGLFLAGFSGYALSYRYGTRLAKMLIKDEGELDRAIASFNQFGVGTILLSRAVPILPEVSACMAGLTRMPKWKFALAWVLSTVPYAVIASYAGSVSTLSNPQPAIITAIGLTAFLWVGLFLYRSAFISLSGDKKGG